jgi:kumamolisin
MLEVITGGYGMSIRQHFHQFRRKTWLSLVSLILILVLLANCGGSNATTKPTPTPTTSSVAALGPMTVLNLNLPQAALHAPITGTVPANQILHVGVTFKINQAILNKLGSTNKIKIGDKLDAKALANLLGISDKTYQEIKTFFGVENATLHLGKLRTNLTIDGKASLFANLLQTRFVTHKLKNRTYYTTDPSKSPMIPKVIADTILAITGLDNYSQPPQHLVRSGPLQPRASKRTHADCQPQSNMIIPSEVAHAYGYDDPFWKAGWHGEHMTVNLVEIDGFDPEDINNYFQCVGFTGKLDTFTIDGNAPAPGVETTLDVDMIAGLASASHMIVYQTDVNQSNDVWTQVNDELQQIINDNADNKNSTDVVSVSLGRVEQDMTPDDIKAIDQSLYLLTNAEHMTVFVSSGDCGAFASGIYGDLSVDFPASDPWAISVGGTTLQLDTGSKRADEIVWSDGSNTSTCKHQWGSGGGLSQVFPRPTWQSTLSTKNQYSQDTRQLPDIAAVADNLAIYYQGQWIAEGGTSAATPIWAAGMMLVNQGLIEKKKVYFYGPKTFYEVASSSSTNGFQPYYNVIQGNNLYYPATPGRNLCTGFGSPNLPDFFNILYSQT